MNLELKEFNSGDLKLVNCHIFNVNIQLEPITTRKNVKIDNKCYKSTTNVTLTATNATTFIDEISAPFEFHLL